MITKILLHIEKNPSSARHWLTNAIRYISCKQLVGLGVGSIAKGIFYNLHPYLSLETVFKALKLTHF